MLAFRHLKMYGRAVPTTDTVTLKYGDKKAKDVVLSRTPRGKIVARYTTPDMRRFYHRKQITHNCFRYDFEFIN